MEYSSLFIYTAIARGLGAGIIFGVGILANPLKSKIAFPEYLQTIKLYYQGFGVKIYAGLTILGLLLTVLLLFIGREQNISSEALNCLRLSFIATIGGFVGTAGAFPTMKKIRQADNDDQILNEKLLSRFEFWQWVSTICHIIAFCTLVISLKYL